MPVAGGGGGLVIAWDATRAEVQSRWARVGLNRPIVQQLGWVKLTRVFPS